MLIGSICCVVLSGCATSVLLPVAAAPIPVLADGEGLLIIDVDTDIAIKRLVANRLIVSENLPKGKHVWIVRAPAGKYQWTQIDFGGASSRRARRMLKANEDEFAFDVVSGQLNYPGELMIRSSRGGRSSLVGISIRNRNHSAMAIRDLRETHSAAIDAFAARYGGGSDDAFLEHYSEERVLLPPPDVPEAIPVDPHAARPEMGDSAELFFSSAGIQGVSVSPNGRWAVARAQATDRYGLMIQKLGGSGVHPVFATQSPLTSIDWVGPERFLATFAVDGRHRRLVGRIREIADKISIEKSWIDAPGILVEPLPLDDEHVIWEFEDGARKAANHVAVRDLIGFVKRNHGGYNPARTGEMRGSIVGTVERWVVDRKGFPRAALRRDDEGFTLLVRESTKGEFIAAFSYLDTEEDRRLVPLSVSADGRKLLVGAYHGGNTLAIVEFDIATRSLGRTVFRRADGDVADVLLDPITGELIAAVFDDEGERRLHYFDSFTTRMLPEMDDEFSSDRVHVVSASADRKTMVLFASGATDPGIYYLRDGRTGDTTEIGERLSRVDREELVETETIEAESADGTKLEAYLTVPKMLGRGSGVSVPLVVIPHGGPIGVRDTKAFDPFVQYLASWGFATLKVNYRGSSGYGLDFEHAGKREWAQAIEDDIDAAVEKVMARSDIDETRICIVGGSYGGFSSLVSVVRHPRRYRCAATLNGVTDIPLMFESSDFSDFDRALERFAEVAGDLEKDGDKLIELSPVYDVSKMEVAILVVYGTEDRRVDPDHAHRLLLMLETYSKAHDSLEIRGAEHGFTRREWVIAARVVRRFLTTYLYSGDEYRPDPELQKPTRNLILEVQR